MHQHSAITRPAFVARTPRPILAVLAIVGVSVAVSRAGAPQVLRAGGPRSSVVTPGELAALMARPPRTWSGQVVWVQGTIIPSTAWTCAYVAACSLQPAAFIVPAAGGGHTRLPVAWGGEDPLWRRLRRLPWVGAVVPQRQAPHWGASALYRVQLEARPNPACGRCVVAVVLDADPPE